MKIFNRNWLEPELKQVYDLQKAMQDLQDRTTVIEPQGILAELYERMGENND